MTTGPLLGRLYVKRTWNRRRSISPADLGKRHSKPVKQPSFGLSIWPSLQWEKMWDLGRITGQTWVSNDHRICHIEKLVLNKERLERAGFFFGCAGVCQLSGWGTQAWLPRGTGNLRPPTRGRTTWPALEGRFLTAGPPGTGKGLFFRHKKSFQPRTANITLRKSKAGGLRSAGRRGAGEEADKQVSGDEQGARNRATWILTKQQRRRVVATNGAGTTGHSQAGQVNLSTAVSQKWPENGSQA